MRKRANATFAALALVVPVFVAGGMASSDATEPVGGTYNPVPATRVYDTNTGLGGRSTPLATLEIVTVPIAGLAGVPVSGAAAVAIDVTAYNAPGTGHLTAWPAGTPRPPTSMVNVSAGQTISNFTIVPLGADGAIQIYDGISSGSTDIAVDVHGWVSAVTDTEAPGRYVPVTQSRIADTRNGIARTGSLASGETWTLRVAGLGGVPTTAAAAALNVTVPGTTSYGSLTVYQADTTKPAAATLDYLNGSTTATFTMASLSAAGEVKIHNSGPAVAHVVVDVMGYITPGGNTSRGGMMELVTPTRVVDTRNGTGGRSTPLLAFETYSLAVRGVAGVPTSSTVSGSALVMVTALGSTSAGYLTVFPSGTTRPATSTVNFNVNVIRPGFLIVPIGSDGKVSIYNGSGGTVHLLFDILGYVTPVTADRAPSAPSALTPSGGATVSDGTPTLSATLSDPDNDRMTTTWTLRDDVTGTLVVDNVQGLDHPSGSTASFDVDPGIVQNDRAYSWRVAACDGTLCTTSAWASFAASGINPTPVPVDTTPVVEPSVACDSDPERIDGDACVAPDDGTRNQPRATTYYGYTGQSYSTTPTNGVFVLTSTVLQKSTTLWGASGMVRNELYQAGADDVVVTATLYDAAGVTLGQATTTITEFNIRPGEPAPFTVTSSVPAADVASVTWSAAATTVTDPIERPLRSDVLWRVGYVEREPIDMGYYVETAQPPGTALPHLIFGEITNDGAETYGSVRLIGAWLNEDGRVLEVVNVPMTDADGVPIGLYPGQSGQFLVVAGAPESAPALAEAEFVMWQVGA